ncbi:MAG: NAD-dependent epimerase/dehydratase [Pseudomonadota bacterium]
MKNVVVTGGAGYVGSGLLRALLQRGYSVHCIDKLDFGGESIVDLMNHPEFRFYNCDLNDWNRTKAQLDAIQLDAIIHLAAIVGDPACKLYSELATTTNLTSSIALADYAFARQIDNFIFASTCSNYGKMKDSNSYVTEESPLAPVSLYAELKVAFERYLISEVPANGVAATALRFATVYGLSPRMRFDLTVNEFTKELALGRKLVVFGEQFWRPYCHVRDFARAFIAVLEADRGEVAGEVFNVGDTSENYTKSMLIEHLLEVFPDAEIEYVQKDEDPRDYRVNCDKIKEKLGFTISARVPDGIREIQEVLGTKVISNPDDQRYYNIPITQ